MPAFSPEPLKTILTASDFIGGATFDADTSNQTNTFRVSNLGENICCFEVGNADIVASSTESMPIQTLTTVYVYKGNLSTFNYACPGDKTYLSVTPGIGDKF